MKLLAVFAGALVSGAVALCVLKTYCLQILHRNTPEAGAMIGRFAITMVFIGLLQALGTWSLASRWSRISLLYGVLGIAYWLVLLMFGKSPADLLRIMPLMAGSALVILFLTWVVAMRRQGGEQPEQS